MRTYFKILIFTVYILNIECIAQVTIGNNGLEVQSTINPDNTDNLTGVILPKAEAITATAIEEGLIFFKNSGVDDVNDGIRGIVNNNEEETLASNPETSRLFKRVELGIINENNEPRNDYLTFNCGVSNTDKNPLVKDQNLGFRPWSIAVKFKPGAKEGTNPIFSQTDDEARKGIYLQLEQNQLVFHFGDYTTSNPCGDNDNQCNSYVTWRSNTSFTPHIWQKVLITFSPEDNQRVTENDIKIFTTNNNEIEDITNQGHFVQTGNGYNKTTAGELFVGLSKVNSGNSTVSNYYKGALNYVMLIPFKVGGNLLNADLLNNPVVWAATHKNQVGIIKEGDQFDYANTSNLWLMGNSPYDSNSKIVNSLDYRQQTEHLELIPNTETFVIKKSNL